MRVAILGLPQCGKRTLFSLLTGRIAPDVRREGEVVEGIAPIKDPRVDIITRLVQPAKTRYAEINVALATDMDPASGKREWLEGARKCDLLCIVIRAFSSAHVYHPNGSVDPDRDRRNLEAEVLLADLELIEKRLDRLGKEKRGGQTPAQAVEEHVLTKCRQTVESGKALLALNLEVHELAVIRSLGLLTLQPILWAYNVDEGQILASRWTGKDEFLVSCLIEKEIAALQDAAERTEYLRSIGIEGSQLERLSRAAYDMLGLMSFYTMGKDEVRAWTIRKGTRAPEAAGKVHSDMERGFIRVEVTKFDDLVAAGSEEAVKKLGKEQLRGKDYVIQDGDICCFLFNV